MIYRVIIGGELAKDLDRVEFSCMKLLVVTNRVFIFNHSVFEKYNCC